MDGWRYSKDGRLSGPVPEAEVAALVRSGGIRPDDSVWCPSMAEWRPARDVAHLLGTGAFAGRPQTPAPPSWTRARRRTPPRRPRNPRPSRGRRRGTRPGVLPRRFPSPHRTWPPRRLGPPRPYGRRRRGGDAAL